MFSSKMRVVYLYAVCFITLLMVIGGLIATVDAITRYVFPPGWGDDVQRLRAIFNSAAWWVIAAPVFILHWRAARKTHVSKEADE